MTPTRALDLQLDLIRRLTVPTYRHVIEQLEIEITADQFHGRIGHAETFYVSPGMTDIIQHAAETLGPDTLHTTDMFSPHAFVVFDRGIPHDIARDYGDPLGLSIRALSWWTDDTPALVPIGWAAVGRDLLPIIPDRWRFDTEWSVLEDPAARLSELDVIVRDMEDNPDGWDDDAIVQVKADMERIKHGAVPYHANIRRLVLATNRLLWQKLAVTTSERATRPCLRRAGRVDGYQTPDYGTIQVIHLRREYDPFTGATDEDRAELGERWWTHRWVVRGHWRNQWYPSLNEHRQVFIAPYVKGPEDRPLLVADKLFSVDR